MLWASASSSSGGMATQSWKPSTRSVFSGAPVVNVLYTMWQHPPKEAPSPMLYVGFLLAAAGGYLVLHFKPQG